MFDNEKYLPEIGNLYQTLNEFYKEKCNDIKFLQRKKLKNNKHYISIYNMN